MSGIEAVGLIAWFTCVLLDVMGNWPPIDGGPCAPAG